MNFRGCLFPTPASHLQRRTRWVIPSWEWFCLLLVRSLRHGEVLWAPGPFTPRAKQKGRHYICPFLLPISWSVNVMTGALAATLDHEVTH